MCREEEVGRGHPTAKTEARVLWFASLQTVRGGTLSRTRCSGEGDGNYSQFGVKVGQRDQLSLS